MKNMKVCDLMSLIVECTMWIQMIQMIRMDSEIIKFI